MWRHLIKKVSPLARALVTITEEGVMDNSKLILHQESRQCCRCQECWYPYNQQTATKIQQNLFKDVKAIRVDSYDNDYVSMTWDDGHVGKLPRHNTAAFNNFRYPTDEELNLAMRNIDSLGLWDKPHDKLLERFNYKDLIQDTRLLQQMLKHLLYHGFVILKGVPVEQKDQEMIRAIDKLHIGPLWRSHYGPTFSFLPTTFLIDKEEAVKDPAYCTDALELHSDLTYYTQPPGVMLFLCIKAMSEGGESIFADSFSAALTLKSQAPHHFDILSSTPLYYADYPGPGEFHVLHKSSVFELCEGELFRVRDTFATGGWTMIDLYSVEERKAWHEAYFQWRRILDDPGRRLEIKLEDGEMTLVDNWRMCHGRKCFTGYRHMCTGYVEMAALRSAYLTMLDPIS